MMFVHPRSRCPVHRSAGAGAVWCVDLKWLAKPLQECAWVWGKGSEAQCAAAGIVRHDRLLLLNLERLGRALYM